MELVTNDALYKKNIFAALCYIQRIAAFNGSDYAGTSLYAKSRNYDHIFQPIPDSKRSPGTNVVYIPHLIRKFTLYVMIYRYNKRNHTADILVRDQIC